MAANQRHPFSQFWDFLQSLDPNQRSHGEGVDRHPPPFPPGFPFGGPHHHPGPHQSWAGPGADFEQWGPWGHPGHWDHWGHHEHDRDHPFRSPHDHREPRQQTPPTPTEDGAAQRDVNDEKRPSPDTVMDDDSATAAPDPEEVAPEDSDDYDRSGSGRRWGRHGARPCGRGGRGGRGSRGHRGGRGGPHRGPPPHHHHPFSRPPHGFPFPPPPPPPYRGSHHPPPPPPFDFSAMFQTLGNLGSHPFVENLREQVQNFRDAQQQGGARSGDNNATTTTANDDGPEDETFSPPIDIFNTPAAYVLHAALPGAKKEDVGVNWDPDTSTLSIAGVVYRPGDEAFLQTLSPSSERRVGAFERTVPLPPAGCEKDGDVDGMGISARMEDGLLVVTVPKVEKEWTEIRKVDIE